MNGPQVVTGYWDDPERTKAAFITPPGKQERYYRTGDLVRQRAPDLPIEYLERIDHQVKIRGNRVELGEIEAVLRSVAGVDQAVAVGWPVTEAGIDGITVFLQAPKADLEIVKEHALSALPSYMVPREYRLVEDMLLNQNRKIDRSALLQVLQES